MTASYRRWALTPFVVLLVVTLSAGCAGVKTSGATGAAGSSSATGAGGLGGGGSSQPPALEGLVTIIVAPPTQTVTFQTGGSATATYTATGMFSDGSSRDVTSLVMWKTSAPLAVVTVVGGVATAHGAGIVDVTATSGSVSGTAKLVANVTGSIMASGFPAGDQTSLDGTATPGAADIKYPLDGALFPGNWGAVTVQIAKTNPGQTSARIAIAGTGVDIKYYGGCETAPGSAAGCYVTLPSAFTATLAASSEASDLALTARLAGGGAGVVEGRAVKVAWTSVLLTGGLYYWTTINNGATTAIYRYDFSGDATAPQPVYTDMQVKDPAVDGVRCIGCHAITHDGKKMAMTLGGSYPASFQMIDVATGARTTYEAPPIDQGYATQTTFNRDGSRMVQMFRGKFRLRSTDAVPMDLGEQLTSIKENKSDGSWSPDGKLFAFDSFDPSAIVNPGDEKYRQDSDMKTGAQLWITDSDDMTLADPPRPLVARKAGFTSYYPSISDDDALVVFNQSDCSAPSGATQYGIGPCDSYDDLSASLNVISTKGGTPATLTRANGAALSGNSWPRWSPDHGMFRGKKLYWVAFSSRRPYGLQVNQKGYQQSNPQLWFAAVSAADEFSGANDPSFAAIWLPGQNPNQASPNGSHVPVWVETVVVIQ
jgi:WD40-like Beta Propeller Repeat